MKYVLKTIIALLLFGILQACQTAAPGSPEAKIIAIQEAVEETEEANEQIVSDIPRLVHAIALIRFCPLRVWNR